MSENFNYIVVLDGVEMSYVDTITQAYGVINEMKENLTKKYSHIKICEAGSNKTLQQLIIRTKYV